MNRTRILTIFFRGITLLLWMGVIFFFSSLSGNPQSTEMPLSFYIERKGAHIVEYMILCLLAIRFFSAVSSRRVFPTVFLVAFVFSIMYGISDEFHQSFVPYRGPKLTDVLIDASGALLGCIFSYVFYRFRNGSDKVKK
ncbi:MAG: VanZ family protein [Candidatus Moranbacteria bacterium]|nr:VanZ family protein [Candidatus Moranbacteria bacterium]MDD3964721.1 VanZ family protein [Candidatus Moranbacteria bacterium]